METDCPVIEDEDETSQEGGGIAAVAVQSQSAAAAASIIQTNETDTALYVDVNNSTLQAVNSQEEDLLGIENLGRLSNLQCDDAIKFIASHIGQFHELVNQKSIKDRQLNVLIQVIGNISSPSCNLDVQKHLIHITANQNFLGNILSYMRDSIAPRIDPVKYEAPRAVFYSTNKPFCTDTFALMHLTTYFTFVEENLKELRTTQEAFTEGFAFLKQLVSSSEQNDETQSNCAISEKDLTSCSSRSRSISRSSLCKTSRNVNMDVDSNNPMSIESLKNLLAKPHKDVLKFVDSHSSKFEELLNQKSIPNPQLIALITFIGVKLCTTNSSLPELRIKVCLVVANFNFVRNIWNYTKRNLTTRTGKLKSLSSLKSNSRSTFAPKVVLKNLLKFFRFVEENLMEAAPTNFAECFNLLKQLEGSYKEVKKDLQAPSDPITISIGHQSEIESAINDPSNTNTPENLLGIEVLSTLLTKGPDEVISTIHNQLGELSKLVHKSITPIHLNVLLQVLVSKIYTFVTATGDADVHVQQLQREILTIVSDSKFLKKLRKHLNKVAKSFLEGSKGQQCLTTNETNKNPPEMALNYTAVDVFENVYQFYNFLLMPKIQNEFLLEFDLDHLEKNITSACELLQQIKSQGKVGEFSDQNPQAFQVLQLSWKKLNSCSISNQFPIKKKRTKKTKAVSPAVNVRPRSTTTSAGDYCASESVSSRIPSERLLRIQVLLFLLTEDSGQVIKTIHNQRVALANLITGSMTCNHLDVLIHILGSKVCSILEHADIKLLQQEIILVVGNSMFFQKLDNHMTKLIKLPERSQDPIPGSSIANSATTDSSCPIQVFKNVLEFYSFLNTTEIRELISLPIYEELVPYIKAIRQLMHTVTMSKGPLRDVFLLDKNPQEFNKLQSSFKKLGSSLNLYLSTYKQLQAITTPSLSSTGIPVPIPTQIILQGQNTISKPQQQRDTRTTTTTSITNIQLGNSNPALFTIDHLIEMKQMPADQVFNLICMERKHFKKFITQNVISDKRLYLLIFIIGSQLCSRTVFVHFQKYLFLMLLEESFLKKIYSLTREIVRHINEQPTPPPYCSNYAEIFENVYKFYNLLLIYCEDPPAPLTRNIRSAYGILQNVIHNKNELSVSTVTELQRIADLFKTLVLTTVERTKMMKATQNEESNVDHLDVDRDSNVPSPVVDADPLGLNILAKLLESSPSSVIEFLHKRRCRLSELVSEPIIMDRRLNVLLQIIASRLCANPVLFVENAQMHREVLESVTTHVFLMMIYNYTNVLRNLVMSPSVGEIFRIKGKSPHCSAMDIFTHSFQYYKFLLSIEMNDTFKLPYSQLLVNINAAALVLNTVETEGKISLFSDKNPAAFQQLRDTAKFLQESFATNLEPKLPLSALLELDSVTLAESTVQSPVPIPRPEAEPKCGPKPDLTIFHVSPSEPIPDTVMDVVDSLITEIEMQELEITNYLGVSGIVRSVFFINRDDEPYINDESKILPQDESRKNEFRPDFLVALCRHVILQNYEASEVKVLVSGTNQALLLNNIFETLKNPFCSVDVGTLSSYDGNTSDVMIISLQGPNFNEGNRQLCNALYKARHGCYILGNKNHLLKSSPNMWTQFFSKFEDDESIGNKLELRCQIHKTDFLVGTPADFRNKAPDGGCCRPCDMPLENCDHRCQKYCHTVDRHHEDYKCQIMIDAKLKCGHMGTVECWSVTTENQLDNSSVVCDSVCGAELDCGHLCFDKCHVFQNLGQETAGEHPPCPEIVEKARLPCNHIVEQAPCFQVMNGEIKPSFQDDPNNKCTVLIKVKLPCGYEYMENCNVLRSLNYINRTCESLCTRPCARGHPCGRVHKCCVDCGPCEERVSRVLPCGHTVSDVACPLDISQLECSYKSCKKADCIIS